MLSAPETVAASVRALGKDARVISGSEAIAEQVVSEAKSGDLLLIMSNGSFDGLCDKLAKKLKQTGKVASEANTR